MKPIIINGGKRKIHTDYYKDKVYYVVRVGTKFIGIKGGLCAEPKARHFKNFMDALKISLSHPISISKVERRKSASKQS